MEIYKVSINGINKYVTQEYKKAKAEYDFLCYISKVQGGDVCLKRAVIRDTDFEQMEEYIPRKRVYQVCNCSLCGKLLKKDRDPVHIVGTWWNDATYKFTEYDVACQECVDKDHRRTFDNDDTVYTDNGKSFQNVWEDREFYHDV